MKKLMEKQNVLQMFDNEVTLIKLDISLEEILEEGKDYPVYQYDGSREGAAQWAAQTKSNGGMIVVQLIGDQELGLEVIDAVLSPLGAANPNAEIHFIVAVDEQMESGHCHLNLLEADGYR